MVVATNRSLTGESDPRSGSSCWSATHHFRHFSLLLSTVIFMRSDMRFPLTTLVIEDTLVLPSQLLE